MTPEEILERIPMPVIEQVPSPTLGKPWYIQLWLYFTEPTRYKLKEDWFYHLPNGIKGMLPKGFVFDGASIPWFLRWLATSFGPLLRAALFHDGGFKFGYLIGWDGHKFAIGRNQKFYDDLFRQIIVWTTGIKPLSWWAWSGVRALGFRAWNKHRRGER